MDKYRFLQCDIMLKNEDVDYEYEGNCLLVLLLE